MAEGVRDGFALNVADYLGFGDAGDFSIPRVRRKKSRKKARRTRRHRIRHVSRKAKRTRHVRHRTRKGKRPYPHWLKKYQFKKRR